MCLQRLTEESHALFLVDRFVEYTKRNRMGPAGRGVELMEESGITVVNQDIWHDTRLHFESDSFDLVTIFDVVEHLPGHPLKLLKEVRRVLKDKGAVLLSGPNLLGITERIKFLLLGKHPYMDFNLWIKEEYYSHYREYTRKEYCKLLDLSGFNAIHSIMVNEPLKTLALNRQAYGKYGGIKRIALFGMYALASVFPNLKPTVYCVGEK